MSNDEKLEHQRHSLAHLLASAVLEHYPEAKPTLGPAVENGFYYDFDFGENKISDEDLKAIQKTMRKKISSWKSFEGKEISPEEAKEFYKDNPYKLELIEEIIEKGEKITFYTCSDFTDLCRGGHTDNLSKIDAKSFELDKTAGAYWRGDENNKMLTRIYGIAFNSKEELDEYKKKREEAKEFDHRKLGKELDLFTFSDMVGAGLPMFTPKGTALRNALLGRLMKISEKYDMQPVTIPHLAKIELYETSGHADKFGDELMHVKSKYDDFVMKPVNCPHHTQIYAGKPRSYRDLPVRLMESTMQYRDEKPGEIGGLTRVRAITVDDGHIFCTPDQVKEEAKRIAKIIEEFYSALEMYGNHWVSLSVRDPKNLDNYIGDDNGWNKAEQMLQEISDEMDLDAKRMEGEAAIYGPKLDYMFKDSMERERQLATIQIDFAMPTRFKLEYTDKDGEKKTPVMIHRAILGSYERFMAILLEHFRGKLPLWLSPVQVKVIPIQDSHNEYAKNISDQLKEKGFRVEFADSDENFNKKIKLAKQEKVPYFLVIGDKDMEANKVTLESRDDGNLGQMSVEELVEKLEEESK